MHHPCVFIFMPLWDYFFRNCYIKRHVGWGCTSVVQHLPSMLEVPDSSSNAKKKKTYILVIFI
jgi:hypothetical protein